MLDLYEELRAIASALDAARVEYALVGGLAVSIYTTPRATKDIDLLVAARDLDRLVATKGSKRSSGKNKSSVPTDCGSRR